MVNYAGSWMMMVQMMDDDEWWFNEQWIVLNMYKHQIPYIPDRLKDVKHGSWWLWLGRTDCHFFWALSFYLQVIYYNSCQDQLRLASRWDLECSCLQVVLHGSVRMTCNEQRIWPGQAAQFFRAPLLRSVSAAGPNVGCGISIVAMFQQAACSWSSMFLLIMRTKCTNYNDHLKNWLQFKSILMLLKYAW